MSLSPYAVGVARLPRTAQAIAVRELRDAIVSGDLAPGSKVIQEAAAQRLGISVIPLREALKELAEQGLLEYRPQRGYFVVELTSSGLARLEEAREVVEDAAERAALSQIDAERIYRIRAAAADHEAAFHQADSQRLSDTNRRFHWLILEPCDNPYLLRFVTQVWEGLEPYRGVVYRRADMSDARSALAPDILADHREIVEAIATGDVAAAQARLARHRRLSDAILERFVETAPDNTIERPNTRAPRR
jgi:DNA-binding GntR family transcriptional regulator